MLLGPFQGWHVPVLMADCNVLPFLKLVQFLPPSFPKAWQGETEEDTEASPAKALTLVVKPSTTAPEP